VLKQSSGKNSVTIARALGAGKALMRHQVVGRWSAAAARRMHTGALQPALKRAYPSARGKFSAMEDNDPTGYKSRSGMAARKSAGTQTLDLPKRPPDLMPLDFAPRAHLNKRMRRQEKDWPANKTETRAQHLAQLRRTASALPSARIHGARGSLHICRGLLVEAKGGHLAEAAGTERARARCRGCAAGARRAKRAACDWCAARDRLVGKQSQQTALLEQVVGEENRNASREVRSATLPRTDKEGLETPAAFADPARLASHRGQGVAPVGAKKLVVCKEYHAPVAGVRRAHCRKPRSALDVDYLAWPTEHQPLTAACDLERRTAREQEVDLWPIAVRSGIRNSPDDPHAARKLTACARTSCSHKVVAWMFKNEHVLEKIIDKAWAWMNVDSFLEDSTKPVMQQVTEALRTPCVCGGRWLQHVRESLSMNRIDAPDRRSSILMSLKHGRCEAAPVVALAGRFGGDGKCLLFSAARPLFGGEHAKAAVLDEWMFIDGNLPGKPAPITMPQNQHAGHRVSMGSAPMSVICPEAALAGLSSESSQRPQGQAGMLLLRLQLYLFIVPIPKPPAPKLAPCPRCFSTLVTSEALKFKPK
ncbi:unnamed protein product, partial [Prorocentrum cordatum]